MSQSFSVIGQVATDPKLFTPESGVQFCSFRLAHTERRFDTERKEWVDRETNWFTINAFRGLALNAKESFRIGDRVIVTGRLRVRKWEKGEKHGTSVEIDADGFGHDLRWGTSTFTKRELGNASLPETDAPEPIAPSEEPSTTDGAAHTFAGDGFIPATPPLDEPFSQAADAA